MMRNEFINASHVNTVKETSCSLRLAIWNLHNLTWCLSEVV